MEINEIKILENLKELIISYFNTANLENDKTAACMAQIKLANYYELGCVITNMLKLCLLALDHDAHKISENNKNSSINITLILEVIVQIFPLEEFEFLSEINKMVVGDVQSVNQ